MRPFSDPARDRADRRRLVGALGISAAVHVAATALWLAAGPRAIPVITPLDEYPPMFVVTDVVSIPDPPAGEAGGAAGGGEVAAPPEPGLVRARSPAEPPSPPPPTDAEPVVREPGQDAPALSRTVVPRTEPVASAPSRLAAPASPGPPSSGPPARSNGPAAAGSGSGTGGPGAGVGTGGAGTETAAGDGTGGGGDGGGGRLVDRPERSPRIRQIAFAQLPPEAREAGASGRGRVRVLVGSDGRVSRAEMVERVFVDRRGRERAVAVLPFGMEASILDAARRTDFQPAHDGGDPVRAYAVITLSVGTDR